MIHVLAAIELRPGQREAFLGEFRKLVPMVRAEKGCLEYGPAIDVAGGIPLQVHPREHVVIVVEKWADVAALKAHLEAPHMAEYRGRVKDLVVNVSLQVLQPA